MTQPLPPRRQRSSSIALIAVALVVILAVVVGGLAAMLLPRTGEAGGRTPSPAGGEASPLDSQSAAATASSAPSSAPTTPASTTPSGTPAVSAVPSSGVAIPDDLLPAGSLIRVTGDGVRIRAQPSTDATVVTTMSAGDFAYVVDSIGAGPLRHDGYDWYLVEYANGEDIWPWQDIVHGELYGGWMAAGTAAERFVELVDVQCPTEPMTLSVLRSTKPWDRLVCLADTPIVIEGTFGCDTCLDESIEGAAPTWLADAEQHPPIAGAYAYYPYVLVAIPPATSRPENRDVVRATLHVDDPTSAACTYAGSADVAATAQVDATAVQIYCRERLVLESFEVIGHDDSGG